MDWLSEIWGQIAEYVSIPYLLTFVMLSYLVKTYFGKLIRKVIPAWRTVYTVLIIATITGIPFLIWAPEITWVKVLFSYSLGCTLHDVIFGYLEKLWKKTT